MLAVVLPSVFVPVGPVMVSVVLSVGFAVPPLVFIGVMNPVTAVAQ